MGRAPPTFSPGVGAALGSVPCHRHHSRHGHRRPRLLGGAVLGDRAALAPLRILRRRPRPRRPPRPPSRRLSRSAPRHCSLSVLLRLSPRPPPPTPHPSRSGVQWGGGSGPRGAACSLSLAGRGEPLGAQESRACLAFGPAATSAAGRCLASAALAVGGETQVHAVAKCHSLVHFMLSVMVRSQPPH